MLLSHLPFSFDDDDNRENGNFDSDRNKLSLFVEEEEGVESIGNGQMDIVK